MLDSPALTANPPLVRQGDGLVEQPSETVGDGNMPILIASLDGDRDFRCRVLPHLRQTLRLFADAGHETSPRTNVAQIGRNGWSVFSCWALPVRRTGPKKE